MSAITPGYGETKCCVCKKGFENGTEIRRSVICGHRMCGRCFIRMPPRVLCYVDGCPKKIHRYQWLKEMYWITDTNRNRPRSTSNYFSQDRLETDNSKGLNVSELVDIFESTRINDSSNIRLPKKLKPIDVTKRDFTRDIEHTLDFPNVKSFKYSGTKPVTDQIQYAQHKPRNLKANSATGHEIDLMFDSQISRSKHSSYVLQQNKPGYEECRNDVHGVDSNTTCYHVNNLQPDTIFRIFSENEAGKYQYDKPYSFHPKCTAPYKPNNLKAFSKTQHEIDLNWDPPNYGSRPTKYILQQQEYDYDEWIPIVEVDSNTTCFHVKNLQPDTKYYFRVFSENEAGRSVEAKTYDFCKTKCTAPYKPNNLKAFSKTQHEIDLNWDPPNYGSRPTKYILQQQEYDYDKWIPIVEVDSNTTCFHVKNLQPDTKYYFRVFSENEAGRSVEAKMYDFCKTKCTAPYKPRNIKAISLTDDQIDLTWDPPNVRSKSSKYIIQQQEYSYKEWVLIGEVDSNTTCFHVKNLQPETKYYFRVFSENEAGRSVEEKTCDFCKTKCTAPLMPTNIRIPSETSTSITIKWDVPDESPKPTSFQIKVKDSITSNIINVYNSYKNEYAIRSLIPDRKYEFCIAAENSGGASSVAYIRHKTIADDIQSTANETKSVTVTPCGDKSITSRKRSLYDEIGHQSSQNDTNGHGSVSASKVSRYGPESHVEGIRGLPNVGMTCYANSIFQVLAQTPNLVSHLEFLQKTNKLKTNSLTKSLLDVLKGVNSISTDIDNIHRKYETVPRNNVYGLVSKVINSDSSFQIGRQNDSHSFLISMFNAIKSEISYNDTKGVLSMFEGELMSRFTYPCKHVEVSEPQMFNSLLIPIDDYEAEWRIEDGIRSLLKEERFRHDLLPCGKCNISDCDTITRKTMEFNQLPDVLILQLGRFKQQHRRLEKIYKTVHYRHTLEPKILKPNMGLHDKKCYILYGVTLHSGSLSGGHYTAYVRCIDTVNGGEDQWYDCSDSYVQKIPKDSVLNDKHAFLLFYHLEETADSISF